MFDICKAAGLIVVNKKLLLEKSGGKEIFVIPGGRIEQNETAQDCLIRELFEEFRIKTDINNLEYLGSFIVDNAKIKDSKVKMETYLVHKWTGDIQIDSEIEDIAWVDSSNSDNLTLSFFASKVIIPMLKEKNLIS